jgi:hypothetical protein
MVTNDEYEHEIHIYNYTMHINGVLSLIFTTLAVYMILYKSPPQMGNYRWYLLNVVVSVFVILKVKVSRIVISRIQY